MKGEPSDTTIPMSVARAPRERHPALVFLRGELLAAPIPFERDAVTLGRALEADARVTDAAAARPRCAPPPPAPRASTHASRSSATTLRAPCAPASKTSARPTAPSSTA